MNIRSLIFTLPLFFYASFALSNSASGEAELFVREFYNWHLSDEGRFSGLPLELQRTKISQYFSVDLQNLLQKAELMEQQCMQNAPEGEKPYNIEGSIIFGLYEGAREVEITGNPKQKDDSLIFRVRGFYIDERFAVASKERIASWIDDVVVEKSGNRWRINDIRHKEGSLRLTLSTYIQQGKKWCAPLQ